MKSARHINWTRLLAAFGTAAVIASLLAGALTFNPFAMVIVLAAVLALEALFVLPVYLALHRSGRVTHGMALAFGFLFGAAPWAWFGWPLRFPELRTTASSNGVQTMVDGVPTLAGWIQYGSIVALFGFFGVLVAHGFWIALGKRRTEAPDVEVPSQQGASPPIANRPSRRRWRAIAVIVAIGGILSLPALMKDRSCHNVFRDVPVYSLGVRSARPKAGLYIPAQTKDWDGIARQLRAFGKERHLDILDLTEQDEHSKQLYVSLCNEGGTEISVLDRVYFFGPPMEPRSEQLITVFGMRPESDWRQQAAALEAFLRKTYGDQLRRDGNSD